VRSSEEAAKPAAAPKDALYVATAADMPACDDASKDRIVYVADEKALKACLAGTWTAVDIASKAMAIQGTLSCSGAIGDTGIHYSYDLTYFTTKDVFASAVIRGNIVQSAKSVFYAHDVTGAQNGTILVVGDHVGNANAGVWTFSMDQQDSGPTLKYEDADLSEPATYTQPQTDCVIAHY